MNALLPPSLHLCTLILTVFCRCMWDYVHVTTENLNTHPHHLNTECILCLAAEAWMPLNTYNSLLSYSLFEHIIKNKMCFVFCKEWIVYWFKVQTQQLMFSAHHDVNEPWSIYNLCLLETCLLSGMGLFYLSNFLLVTSSIDKNNNKNKTGSLCRSCQISVINAAFLFCV